MTDIDPPIEQLRAAAMAATPGPWFADPGRPYPVGRSVRRHTNQAKNEQEWVAKAELTNDDARYIALANPAAILALLDRLEKAEAERNALRNAMPFRPARRRS